MLHDVVCMHLGVCIALLVSIPMCTYIHVCYCVLLPAVRTSSMSTFDSVEFARFSDDSMRDNDRVAGECVCVCVCVH